MNYDVCKPKQHACVYANNNEFSKFVWWIHFGFIFCLNTKILCRWSQKQQNVFGIFIYNINIQNHHIH